MRTWISLWAVAILVMCSAPAQAGTTWDGEGVDLNWTTAENWDLDTLPSFDGSEDIVIETLAGNRDVLVLDGDKSINSLTFGGTYTGVDVSGDTLYLTSGNITQTNLISMDSKVSSNIVLGADGTFSGHADTETPLGYTDLWIRGDISDDFDGDDVSDGRSLEVTGGVALYGNNTFTGGLYVADTAETDTLVFSENALGAGTVHLQTSDRAYYYGTAHADVPGDWSFETATVNWGESTTVDHRVSTMTGTVTLDRDVTFSSKCSPSANMTTWAGDWGESVPGCKVTFNADGWLAGIAISGKLNNTGGIEVRQGFLRLLGDNTGMTQEVLVNGGQLGWNSDASLGDSTITLRNGSTIEYVGLTGTTATLLNAIEMQGSVFHTLYWKPVYAPTGNYRRGTGTMGGPVTLLGDTTLIASGGAGTWSGDISDGAGSFNLTIDAVEGAWATTLDGDISIGGNLSLKGQTNLNGDNTGVGGNVVFNASGTYEDIRFNSDEALGNNTVIVNAAYRVYYTGTDGETINNDWQFNLATFNSEMNKGPDCILAGDVEITQNLTFNNKYGGEWSGAWSDGAGQTLTFAGSVNATTILSGNLDLDGQINVGDHRLHLMGDNSASSAPITLLAGQGGELRAGSNTAWGTGTVTINDGSISSSSGVGITLANDIVLNAATLKYSNNGQLTFTAEVDAAGSTTPTIDVASGGTLNLAGGISADATDVTKNGAGTLIIGTSAHGNLVIDGGTVLAEGNTTGTGTVTVNAGATLGGSGSIAGEINILGATVAPGASTGTLTVGGNATFNAFSDLSIEIDGLTDYDQLAVGGDVSLQSETIEEVTYAPTLEAVISAYLDPGDVLTIIDNQGAGAVAGIFDGLDEGATITLTPTGKVKSATATISYVGGTGNDITLTDFAVTLKWILGDMDGSGAVNNNDITPFVLALTDRATYLATYPGIDPDLVGDIDDSGALNNNDITPFVTLLTTGSYPQAVPEPATMALLTLGGLALLKRRSR